MTYLIVSEYKYHKMEGDNTFKIYESGSIRNVKEKQDEGTYGQVIRGVVKDEKRRVVVKRNTITKEIDFMGSIRELSMLIKLGHHPFIVSLDGISFNNPFDSSLSRLRDRDLRTDDLFFLFPEAAYDGDTFAHGKPRPSFSYIKAAMVQLLLAIEFLHAKGVVHRDIKPANLLWFREGDERFMRLCDFGLSMYYTKQRRNSYEVVTAGYRAPEIFLRSYHDTYDYKSDMWSVGCVFFEMVSSKPFVKVGRDNPHHLASAVVSQVPVPPTPATFEKLNYIKVRLHPYSFTKYRSLLNQLKLTDDQIKSFNSASVGGNLTEFVDLLSNLLCVDPSRRFSATQALSHPFFKSFQDYIAECRQMFPPTIDPSPTIKIVSNDNELRKHAIRISKAIWENRYSDHVSSWYEDRMLFLALDIFDRYLSYVSADNEEDDEENVDDLSLTTIRQLKFLTCLYISIKVSAGMISPPSYKEVVFEDFSTPQCINYVKKFEMKVMSVLGYDARRPTILETADLFECDILTSKEICELLDFYCNLHDEETTAEQLWQRFRPDSQPLKDIDCTVEEKPRLKFKAFQLRVAKTSNKSAKAKAIEQHSADDIKTPVQSVGERTVAPQGPIITVRTYARGK